jgi:hypothetical protein
VGMNGIDIRRRLLISKASAPSLPPVTDGLTLCIDGRDGIYDVTFQRVAKGLESNLFYVYDRATLSYRLFTPYGYPDLGGRDNGSGVIEFVKGNTDADYGGLQITGNMPNIRSVEFALGVDTANINNSPLHNAFLISDSTVYCWIRGGDGILFAGDASHTISDTSINHYVVTLGDDLVKRLYVNGVLVSMSTTTYNVFTETQTILTIASANATPVGTVIEQLKSLRMYTSCLTADEIAQNYAYEQSTGRVL